MRISHSPFYCFLHADKPERSFLVGLWFNSTWLSNKNFNHTKLSKNSDSPGIFIPARIPFCLIKASGLACDNLQREDMQTPPAATVTPSQQRWQCPAAGQCTETAVQALEARPVATVNPLLPFKDRRTWRTIQGQAKHPGPAPDLHLNSLGILLCLQQGTPTAMKLWIGAAMARVSWPSTTGSDFTPSSTAFNARWEMQTLSVTVQHGSGCFQCSACEPERNRAERTSGTVGFGVSQCGSHWHLEWANSSLDRVALQGFSFQVLNHWCPQRSRTTEGREVGHFAQGHLSS